jgi:hypothetical protein
MGSSSKNDIEDEIRDLQAAADDILMEIRRLLSDIENPFTLIGKVAIASRKKPKKEEKESVVKSLEKCCKEEQEITGSSKDAISASKPTSSKNQVGMIEQKDVSSKLISSANSLIIGSSRSITCINAFLLADLMNEIFGMDGAKRALEGYLKKRWIDEKTWKIILNAMEFLPKEDERARKIDVGDIEDHVAILYLIDLFANNTDSLLLTILIQTLLKLRRLIKLKYLNIDLK